MEVFPQPLYRSLTLIVNVKEMPKEIVEIDIDKLVLDKCNVRGNIWQVDSKDKEMADNVENEGVMNACIVRSLEDGKFGVVCGGRRFNASVDAGKETVPCVIKAMDDLTAFGMSFNENYHWRPVGKAGHVLAIGKIVEDLKAKGYQKAEDFVKKIMEMTSIPRTTVQKYINASKLPPEVIELMKPKAERDLKIIEILKQKGLDIKKRKLSLDKADILGALLIDEQGQVLDKRVLDIAAIGCKISYEKLRNFVKSLKVQSYPKLTAEEAFEKLGYSIGKDDLIEGLYLGDLKLATHSASRRENLSVNELLLKALREYLIRGGYV